MPERKRCLPMGCPIHVTLRSNDRRLLFATDADYQHTIDTIQEALGRFAVEIDAYEVMPNHFHFIVRQQEPGAIPAFVHRIALLTARWFRESDGSVGQGHVFQRRYWSSVVQRDGYYLVAIRYVEANACRAGLVARAEDWKWGSLWERVTSGRSLLAPSRRPMPRDWTGIVNRMARDSDYDTFRRAVKRGRPLTRVVAWDPAEQAADLF